MTLASTRSSVVSVLVPLLAILAVAGSIYLRGVRNHEDAKDIDTPYFYVAAKCWAAGTSPYDPDVYSAMGTRLLGAPLESRFAYLPTLGPVVMPLALFSKDMASVVFSWMNFAAAMVLFWACYRLVRELSGGPLTWVQWVFVALGAGMQAVSATIFTGQTTLFVAAAAGIALLGARLGTSWMVVLGVVFATAKPQLSGPLLLFLFLFEPKQRKAVGLAVAITAAIVGAAALFDHNIVHSYVASIKLYGTLWANKPENQVGLITLLVRQGVALRTAQVVGVGVLLAVLAVVAWLLVRTRARLTENPVAMMLLVFSAGLATPYHHYDLCWYALGLALLAMLRWPFQLACLVPVLLLFRPRALHHWTGAPGPDSEFHFTASTLSWLFLLAMLGFLAVRQAKASRLQPVT